MHPGMITVQLKVMGISISNNAQVSILHFDKVAEITEQEFVACYLLRAMLYWDRHGALVVFGGSMHTGHEHAPKNHYPGIQSCHQVQRYSLQIVAMEIGA